MVSEYPNGTPYFQGRPQLEGGGLHRLVVFSDDWGVHPSSCQHLVRQLLPRYPTIWVNTIGTRTPKLSREDSRKAVRRISQWLFAQGGGLLERNGVHDMTTSELGDVTVLTPAMYPGFRSLWQRRLNRRLITRSVNRALGKRLGGEVRTAITTVPITADLPRDGADDSGGLDVDQWVYYCVDDFSVWPGLDGSVLEAMDQEMAMKANRIVSASQTLSDRLARLGRHSTLLTHGIDQGHWDLGRGQRSRSSTLATELDLPMLRSLRAEPPRPIFLSWGVIDKRLDEDLCLAIAEHLGTLILIGPLQSPSSRLVCHPQIIMLGPRSYNALPALAAQADILVMPYADLPVTRAMQPLKFKEYLATGKPVIARRLPAILEWSGAADLIGSVDDLIRAARIRLAEGVPAEQVRARLALASESWSSKALEFERVLLAS